MQQRQASIGGDGTNLVFEVSVRYASVILGSDHMGDLLGSGSAELRIVRDAEAVGGVQLPGLTSQVRARLGLGFSRCNPTPTPKPNPNPKP